MGGRAPSLLGIKGPREPHMKTLYANRFLPSLGVALPPAMPSNSASGLQAWPLYVFIGSLFTSALQRRISVFDR